MEDFFSSLFSSSPLTKSKFFLYPLFPFIQICCNSWSLLLLSVSIYLNGWIMCFCFYTLFYFFFFFFKLFLWVSLFCCLDLLSKSFGIGLFNVESFYRLKVWYFAVYVYGKILFDFDLRKKTRVSLKWLIVRMWIFSWRVFGTLYLLLFFNVVPFFFSFDLELLVNFKLYASDGFEICLLQCQITFLREWHYLFLWWKDQYYRERQMW